MRIIIKTFLSKLPAFVFALAITIFAFHVSAEGTSTIKTLRGELQDKRQEVRTELQQKRGEIKTSISQEREKIKAERVQFVNERVGKLVDQMIKRFNTALERLVKIADRVDSRIAKVKANGKDTSLAEKSVSDARAKIEQAKTDIAKIPGLINEAVATTTPKERFSGLRELANTIRGELESARTSLKKAVKILRELNPEPHATSTEDSSRSAN